MSAGTQEVLREHFEECFKHFGECFSKKMPRGTLGRGEAMQPMVRFFNARPKTIQRWLDRKAPLPVGDYCIKFVCYLDLHGYKIIEFERMPKILHNFAELIGFSVLSSKEAADLIQLQSAQHLYQIIWCKTGLSKSKEDRMWSIWKERRNELECAKKNAFENARLEIISVVV